MADQTLAIAGTRNHAVIPVVPISTYIPTKTHLVLSDFCINNYGIMDNQNFTKQRNATSMFSITPRRKQNSPSIQRLLLSERIFQPVPLQL